MIPDPENFEVFAKLVLDAVASKNWALLASLGVVLAVFLARRYSKWAFLKTDRGGALLVLGTSFAGAVATALLAGTPLGAPLFVAALKVAFTAAGGFGLVKKLLFPSDGPERVARANAAGEEAAVNAPVKSPLELVNK